jgi:CubicO group peptidase (beta-lactamase class C family)
MALLLLLATSLFLSCMSDQPNRADLVNAIDEIADDFVPFLKNVGGYQVAAQVGNGEIVRAARGAVSRMNHSPPITNDDAFFFGSLTKHITAALTFKMVEEGKLNLSTKVHTILDPFLRRTAAQRRHPFNFTSLESLWGLQANNITFNHLGRMQSGIPDQYISKFLWQDSVSEPAHNFSPFELMYKSGPLNFAPGSSCKYSTTGFAVLGLALCAMQGCESEHQLDMLAWLPSDLRRKLSHTVFPTNGTPADVSPIHACEIMSGAPVGKDVFNIGGTFSGYTAAFMASTASEAAQLLYAINSAHSDCLSNESRRLMRLVERTDIRPYGFGTEIFAPSFLGMPGALYSHWGSQGHEGRTYGYISWSYFIPAMDTSIAVITSNEYVPVVGMACLLANKIKNMMFNESQACHYWTSANWQHPGGCHCTTPGPHPAPTPAPTPAPAPAPAPALKYTCSNNRCVESKDGLPYDKCMPDCALYTCINNKCVEADHGVPLKSCNKICLLQPNCWPPVPSPSALFCHTTVASSDPLYPAAEAVCEACKDPSACNQQAAGAAKCAWAPRECGVVYCHTQISRTDPVYPAAEKECTALQTKSVCNDQSSTASKCAWESKPCAQLLPGFRIKGPSIAAVQNVSSPDLCCDICSCTSGCIAFTLTDDGGQCELKAGTSVEVASGFTTGLLTKGNSTFTGIGF